jgi:hypothetical protein
MDEQDLLAKWHHFAAGSDAARLRRAAGLLLDLENLNDIRELTGYLG